MAMGNRLWRVMRGVGRSVGDSLRRPSRDERQAREDVEQALAEQEARAEIEALDTAPTGPIDLPRSTSPTAGDRLGELPGTASDGQATATGFSLPQSYVPPADPALAPHYATLELPPSATIEQIEHAYRRLKALCDPARSASDPLEQARARQREARLDEAYLSLRQALVRERRL